MSEGVLRIKNALISVYYKEKIAEMSAILKECGIKLLSSAGTARTLKEAGIETTDISNYTGYPPLFGHRVVTLHPKIHGGILYRRDNETDLEEVAQHGILDIGLVVVNLYPAQEALAKPDADWKEIVELTDIGGPTLVRAAAKNHRYVGGVVDPEDYLPVANEIKELGGLTLKRRINLAQKVFQLTSEYDRGLADFYKILGGRNDPLREL